MKKSGGSVPVYSTEHGSLCPGCSRPARECRCADKARKPGGDGVVRIQRQTKGRKGAGVCLISGLDLDLAGLTALAKRLKAKAGAGGTVKDGIIEIQGDHRELLARELSGLGYRVKFAGG